MAQRVRQMRGTTSLGSVSTIAAMMSNNQRAQWKATQRLFITELNKRKPCHGTPGQGFRLLACKLVPVFSGTSPMDIEAIFRRP